MTKQIHLNRSSGFGEIARNGEAFVAGIAEAAGALVNRFKAWNDKRLMRAALDALNEHLVRDIGFERREVNYFVSDPHNYDRRLKLYIER